MKRLFRSPVVQQTALALLGLLLVLAFWWACTRANEGSLLSARFTPSAAFASLKELLLSPELVRHTLVSLRRIGVGLAWALALGVPLGLLVGSSRRVAWTTSAAFQFLRMISPLSLMPIAVMSLGVGDQAIYFLLAFAALWPITLNTAAGVRALDARYIELGRSLSATRLEMLLFLVVPGILSHVLTGVRLALGVLWIVLVPSEMLGVSAGLGYFILDTRDRLAYSELMAMVVFIGALGFLLDGLARLACRRWHAA